MKVGRSVICDVMHGFVCLASYTTWERLYLFLAFILFSRSLSLSSSSLLLEYTVVYFNLLFSRAQKKRWHQNERNKKNVMTIIGWSWLCSERDMKCLCARADYSVCLCVCVLIRRAFACVFRTPVCSLSSNSCIDNTRWIHFREAAAIASRKKASTIHERTKIK